MEHPTYSVNVMQQQQYPQQQGMPSPPFPQHQQGMPFSQGAMPQYPQQGMPSPQFPQQPMSAPFPHHQLQGGMPSAPLSQPYPPDGQQFQFPQHNIQPFNPQDSPQIGLQPQFGFGPDPSQQQSSFVPEGGLIGAIFATQYRKLWDDTKVNAYSEPASLYEPMPQSGFFVVGHVAERGHNNHPQKTRCLLLSEVTRGKSGLPLLVPPTDFKEIWNDQKTSGKFGHVSIWFPIAPKGYVTLGFVATIGYDKPSKDSVRCVHEAVVAPAKCAFEDDDDCIWNDRNSHARLSDCSWWRLLPKQNRNRGWQAGTPQGVDVGTFAVSTNYNRPQGIPFYCLNESNIISRELGLPRNPYYPQGQEHMGQPGQAQPYPGYPGQQGGYPTGIQVGPAVNIVAFALQPQHALEKFHSWKESLWFAPSALKNATEADIKLKPIFVPYYIFDVRTTSTYSGEYGKNITVTRSPTVHVSLGSHHHSGGHHHHHGGVHTHGPETYTETRWERGGGCRHKEYNDKRICATTNKQLGSRLKAVSDWDTSVLQVGSTDASALTEPIPWHDAWHQHLEKSIIHKEQSACESELKLHHHADAVRFVKTTTKFDEIKYKTIYLPLYEASYNYSGTYYRVVINGQTGKVDGERPVGLGKVGEIFDTISSGIAGMFKGEEEPVGWIDGNTLSTREPKTGGLFNTVQEGTWYHPKGHYLLFPQARTGWIEVENQGNCSVVLGSQKRKTGKIEHICRLKPRSKGVYNYSGHWCIRALKGTPETIVVVGVNTSQYSNKVDKIEGNKLHMLPA